MALSLTTRRRLQTSSSKWTSQHQVASQHLAPPLRKQRSFTESSATKLAAFASASSRGNNLQRGLSVGRSQDTQRAFAARSNLGKASSCNIRGSSAAEYSEAAKLPRANDLIKRNISACGQPERSRSHQAWSSTSSILKSLDRELAHLNGSLAHSNSQVSAKSTNSTGAKLLVASEASGDKNESGHSTAAIASAAKNHTATRTSTKAESSRVNLSIVLSHAFSDCRETDNATSDVDDSGDIDETLAANKKSQTNNNQKPASAQQRRLLYQSARQSIYGPSVSHATASTASPVACNAAGAVQGTNCFNASPSLTVQKRPPLVRAMSAPVRSLEENSKGSFLVNKRKPRRRKLNARSITCDKDSDSRLLTAKDLKAEPGGRVLQRSKSVAPDLITLVSLLSSEGSDSEKEDCATSPSNSYNSSPARRAPTLRKSGKSVSFQENYPPTFQFASKEYSHMLRRGSIAPLAARIKSNRPPTAPPVSIFHTASGNTAKAAMELHGSSCDYDAQTVKDTAATGNVHTLSLHKKAGEDDSYQYPEYVRSLKERECWKLYQKMSTKGVNITYDTILRGMLTPTEFRQLQKQRELEEAKALKESEDAASAAAASEEQQKTKSRMTPLERLAEANILNN